MFLPKGNCYNYIKFAINFSNFIYDIDLFNNGA